MNTTHIKITRLAEKTYYAGVLFQSLGDRSRDFIGLTIRCHELGLCGSVPQGLLQLFDDDDFDAELSAPAGLDYLCSLLSSVAAPGYEFTPSFLNGRTVWGWFPRQG